MSEIDLKNRATYRTWTTDTLRYNDLDPNGHVNNVATCMFLEDGRVSFRRQHYTGLVEDILTGFVLARYTIEYLRPLHFPGSVDIGTTIVRVGRSSYTFGQGVFQDETCVATAEAVQVRISPDTGRSMPLDDDFNALLQSHLPAG
ncbi:MAG: thioesterase family protein [Gammaproteobacteria bacterium]|nr:thioesterase family protein [Gammaproteobacteria bacterium]